MNNNYKTKYDEFIKTQEFQKYYNKDITDYNYLTQQKDINRFTVPLKLSNDDQEQLYTRVLFFQSSFYHYNKSYIQTIDGKEIDLLKCFYKISYDRNGIFIAIQEFTGRDQIIHKSIEFNYKNEMIEISGSLLGNKYIAIIAHTSKEIMIRVVDLKLNLLFEYNKDYKFIYNAYGFEPFNYDSNDLDYIEPGIIFALTYQYCFRIDLNKLEIIEQDFQFRQEKLLIRVMKITNDEFNFYFKSVDEELLQGYIKNPQNIKSKRSKNNKYKNINSEEEQSIQKNNDLTQEDVHIVFVILSHKIYQLNVFNLKIMRITSICKDMKKMVKQHKSWVVPLQIKNRNRREFSQWTFLFSDEQGHYQLFDWKDRDMFEYIKQKEINLDNNEIEDVHQEYTNEQYTSRIICDKNRIYILFQDKNIDQGGFETDYFRVRMINVQKNKGDSKYNYSQILYQNGIFPTDKNVQKYFTSYFFIKYFFTPIILNNSYVIYPTYMEISWEHYYFIREYIAFHSFQSQSIELKNNDQEQQQQMFQDNSQPQNQFQTELKESNKQQQSQYLLQQQKYILDSFNQDIQDDFIKNNLEVNTFQLNEKIIRYNFTQNNNNNYNNPQMESFEIEDYPENRNQITLMNYYYDKFNSTQIYFQFYESQIKLYYVQLPKMQDIPSSQDSQSINREQQQQDLISCKLKPIQKIIDGITILNISTFFNDESTQQIYIPILFYDNKDQQKKFGILNISEKRLIEETIQIVKYCESINSYYEKETGSLKILFVKAIKEMTYLSIHELSFKNIKKGILSKIKFINLHKLYVDIQYENQQKTQNALIVQTKKDVGNNKNSNKDNNNYITIYSLFIAELNCLIELNSKHKFEIHSSQYSFKQDYYSKSYYLDQPCLMHLILPDNSNNNHNNQNKTSTNSSDNPNTNINYNDNPNTNNNANTNNNKNNDKITRIAYIGCYHILINKIQKMLSIYELNENQINQKSIQFIDLNMMDAKFIPVNFTFIQLPQTHSIILFTIYPHTPYYRIFKLRTIN